MLQIKGLSAAYSEQKAIHFPDWKVAKGEHCLILGSSGCGKTTLLHIIGGLLQPKAGEVLLDNTSLYQLKAHQRDLYRGQNIGLIFQKPHLIDSLTVKENLYTAQYFAGLPQDEKRIQEVLHELNLGDKLNARTFELSQGEAQRASIARALLNRPKVILADEPTASLDDDNCHAVVQLLQREARLYQAALIIATHDQRIKEVIPEVLQLDKQLA
ncbi:ATP-binding cassette domain-containing protein [Rapidithrix thailandica]|uniref:ATP-binding cassette domain-containing protein n=1 Tax=Rapidithrix thailandica TaxID=413964 RepID=A0AAW9S5M1_9BACT